MAYCKQQLLTLTTQIHIHSSWGGTLGFYLVYKQNRVYSTPNKSLPERASAPSSLVYEPLLAGADASLWDLVQYFVLLIEMCAVWSL